jgi:lipopolysaccharide transport system permease protein
VTTLSTHIESPLRSVTFIRPRNGWQTLDLRELWRYRDLLLIFTLREIQVRYKQTILGVFWAIIQPLAMSGILSAMLAILVSPGNQPGFIATFCAMLPWQLFSGSLTQSGSSLVNNQRLITKVYFPRLIIPLSGILGALADFAIALVALLIVMVCTGMWPSWRIVMLPAFVLFAIMVALSIGVWLAALSAIYRDFRHVIPFIVQIGFFASPVMYSTQKIQSALPEWMMPLYGLNPMTGVIEGFRWCLLTSAPAPGLLLIPSLTMTFGLMIGGTYYFRRMERWFADVI